MTKRTIMKYVKGVIREVWALCKNIIKFTWWNLKRLIRFLRKRKASVLLNICIKFWTDDYLSSISQTSSWTLAILNHSDLFNHNSVILWANCKISSCSRKSIINCFVSAVSYTQIVDSHNSLSWKICPSIFSFSVYVN